MSSRITYTDEPLGDLRIVPDFLPSPKELAYQPMIRQLIDAYVDAQQRNCAADESHAEQGSGR